MRDLLMKKFERACQGMGFSPVPVGTVFVADDGLQVAGVMAANAFASCERIDRRATLAAMSSTRKVCPRVAGRRYAADFPHAHRATRPNEEAPGAPTPRAS